MAGGSEQSEDDPCVWSDDEVERAHLCAGTTASTPPPSSLYECMGPDGVLAVLESPILARRARTPRGRWEKDHPYSWPTTEADLRASDKRQRVAAPDDPDDPHIDLRCLEIFCESAQPRLDMPNMVQLMGMDHYPDLAAMDKDQELVDPEDHASDVAGAGVDRYHQGHEGQGDTDEDHEGQDQSDTDGAGSDDDEDLDSLYSQHPEYSLPRLLGTAKRMLQQLASNDQLNAGGVSLGLAGNSRNGSDFDMDHIVIAMITPKEIEFPGFKKVLASMVRPVRPGFGEGVQHGFELWFQVLDTKRIKSNRRQRHKKPEDMLGSFVELFKYVVPVQPNQSGYVARPEEAHLPGNQPLKIKDNAKARINALMKQGPTKAGHERVLTIALYNNGESCGYIKIPSAKWTDPGPNPDQQRPWRRPADVQCRFFTELIRQSGWAECVGDAPTHEELYDFFEGAIDYLDRQAPKRSTLNRASIQHVLMEALCKEYINVRIVQNKNPQNSPVQPFKWEHKYNEAFEHLPTVGDIPVPAHD